MTTRPEWEDTTTYSRGQTDRVATTFTRSYSRLFKITVTCGHRLHPGEWVMHCHALGFDTRPLNAKTREEAQNEAENRVREQLSAYLALLK